MGNENQNNDNGKWAFFRQGAWMLTATLASGILMFAVHIFAPWMPKAEYGLFGTLLQILNLMMIPALGLQTVFARQTAAAITAEQHRQLASTVRALLGWTFALWLVMLAASTVAHPYILTILKIDNPAALWVTIALGLPQLWLPILLGLLQGRQNFLWLGMASIVNGIGRFTSTAIIVVILGGYAAGAITGALIGILLALVVAFYQTRSIWTADADPFQWRPWVKDVLPLTFGLGVSFFMMSADMLVARSVFDEDFSGLYSGAGLFGRGLVLFTTPLAAVMFPKIVRAVAYAESTDVLAQALLATAFLAGMVAVGGSVTSALLPSALEWLTNHPLGILNGLRQTLLDNTETLNQLSILVPRFVWAMVPLTLANVLINNLLARQRFQVVPWLVAIAAGYGVALRFFNETPFLVLRTLGTFNLLLLLATLYFSFKKPAPQKAR